MLRCACRSEIGGRARNEDCAKIGCFHDVNCYVVCDGLGGHRGGAEASQMTADRMLLHFGLHPELTEENLSAAFEEAQAQLLARQEALGDRNMLKTTASVLLVSESEMLWGHVGDTRIYLFRRGRLAGRTLDHSVPQMRVNQGELRESHIRKSPDRNRLLRVLGEPWAEERYEISAVHERREYDAALLCSDGFWEYIREPEMCRLLRRSHGDPEAWLAQMYALIGNRTPKDTDNATAIAVIR